MTRRSLRRSLAALCTAGLAVGALGITLGGAASAEVPSRVPGQVATPPPPGGGIRVTVGGQTQIVAEPQPVGPISFT